MRIVTWNINGIRSLKADWKDVLSGLNADIICLQETKVTRDNLDETTAFVEGFSSYFSFSRKRTGYSGVATFCRPDYTPSKSEEGLSGTLPSALFPDAVGHYEGITDEFSPEELRALDSEGRCVVTCHDTEVEGKPRSLVLFNVYCPRADCEKPEREVYQLKFYKLLEIRANALIQSGHIVVIVGDVNCSHKVIDHCDPYEELGERPSRKWLDHLLVEADNADDSTAMSTSSALMRTTSKAEANGTTADIRTDWMVQSSAVKVQDHSFVDAFRKFHPKRESAFTCWMTRTNCRENNYGTRLDYILVSSNYANDILVDCDICPEIMGSDHCPVVASFNLPSLPASKPPKYCTKFFSEFSGTQQKLSAFFAPGNGLQAINTIEKRKAGETTSISVGQAMKKPKPEQKSLLSFFKPQANKSSAAVAAVDEENDENSCSSSSPLSSSSSTENPKRNEEIDPTKRVQASEAWKSLMKGPPTAPLCSGHREPTELKTVKKKGPNAGRQFWCCRKGEGKPGDPNTRCDFFQWRR